MSNLSQNYPMGVSPEEIEGRYFMGLDDSEDVSPCTYCKKDVMSEIGATREGQDWIHDECMAKRTESAADAAYAFAAIVIAFGMVFFLLAEASR